MLRPAFLARLDALVSAAQRGEEREVDPDIVLAAKVDALAQRYGIDPRVVMQDIEFYTNISMAGSVLPAAISTYNIKSQENRRAAQYADWLKRQEKVDEHGDDGAGEAS